MSPCAWCHHRCHYTLCGITLLLISLIGLHCCLQELAKKDAKKKEEREKRMKHRRSSSKEEWIPRSPSGEAVVGPVPTSMKMKPNPSFGGMAQPRPHGERRVWDGARGLSCVCRDIHMCLCTCQHKKQISSIVEQRGERFENSYSSKLWALWIFRCSYIADQVVLDVL